MDELSLVSAIRACCGGKGRGVALGIGDDCAILRLGRGEELLATTDFVIEDVHFRRKTHTAADVGWKALGRGLSDVAAMGGEARWALVSLALPKWAGLRWVKGFYEGVGELGTKFGVSVVGGDVTRSEKLTADVVVLGVSPMGEALRRTGARVGDGIYVSGALGHAAVSGYREKPAPRLELGRKLRGKASACMDLSDGLALDLRRMCEESGVSAWLDGVLPAAPGATLEQALGGGEDYELLCTIPEGVLAPRGLTRIGTVQKGKAGEVWFAGVKMGAAGWDPFR
ncbi:MAG: thiamine-phosphate kinase [Acidobacteria bacterium]|nr:thiamine-phosphate kinase [Acidobacteriota bacterium]